MYGLIMYDINSSTKIDKNRLNKVMRFCSQYGQRIQNSVFEVRLDYDEFIQFEQNLLKLIDSTKDSLKFYYLGNSRKLKQYGIKQSYDLSEILIV